MSFSAVRPHPLVPRRWAGSHIDASLAVALAVASVGYVVALAPGGTHRPVTTGAILLAVAGPLALLWRQTAPLMTQAWTSSVVVLNAAAGLVAAGLARDLVAGAERAAEAIDSGGAAHALDRLVEVSNA